MKRSLAYLLIGLSVFLLVLVARLPASIAYGWLSPSAFTLEDIEGTVWNGRARALYATGISLGDTDWQFRFSALFRARLAYHVTTELAGFPVAGIAATGFGGKLYLRQVQGRFPLQALRESAPDLLAQLAPASSYFDCAIDFDLARVDLVQGWPVYLAASLTIEDLKLLTMRPPLLLGSFGFSFEEQDTVPLIGLIADAAGDLDVEGRLSLDDKRCYALEGSAAAHSGAAPAMQQVLAFLGPGNAEGRRPIRRVGCL